MAAAVCYGQTQCIVTCRQKRLLRLQDCHPETREWGPETGALKEAVALLCVSKVGQLQQQVGYLAQQFNYTKWLQARIGDISRKEHKKLGGEMGKLAGRLAGAVNTLVGWEVQRQRYNIFLQAAGSAGMRLD